MSDLFVDHMLSPMHQAYWLSKLFCENPYRAAPQERKETKAMVNTFSKTSEATLLPNRTN
jgi:hypothetical protein